MTEQLDRLEQHADALTVADRERIADYAAAGVAENTRRAYWNQADRFAEWAAGRSLEPLAALTDAGLAAYLSERADAGASPATLSQAVAAPGRLPARQERPIPTETGLSGRSTRDTPPERLSGRQGAG